MSNPYMKALSTPVPQGEQLDPRQVKNSAGGFVFTVDDKARLERFLILGTDVGTYYITEKDLTKQNIDFLVDLIKRDPVLVHSVNLDVSTNGRAFRNSPSIFTLALMFKHGPNSIKSLLQADLPKICRTSTHLFEFCQYLEFLGGWSRARRSAVAGWYGTKSLSDLAYQVVKYRSRAVGGSPWTHRDALRLSHGRVDHTVERFIKRWYKDEQNSGIIIDERRELDIIRGFEIVQEPGVSRQTLKNAIEEYKLPWEALPTDSLKDPDVWKTLFHVGQLKGQALVRNITRLARIGAFTDMVFAREYADRLADEEMIRRTRLHPINFLNAVVVHQEGQVPRGQRGPFNYYSGSRTKDWTTVPVIVDALNEGFHKAFKYIEPANKRTLIGLDVSGSMSGLAVGLDLSCSQVTAAMSMSIAKTEPFHQIMGFASTFRDLGISSSMDLSSVMRKISGLTFGSTDCSLPMLWAKENKIEVDTFLVMTDNETWAGKVHPHVALRDYRQKMGIDAKLVVVGITATDFTIADPTDRGMMDCVGADSNLPKVISEFSAGRI